MTFTEKLHIDNDTIVDCFITFNKVWDESIGNCRCIVFVPTLNRFYLARRFPNNNMLWKQPDNETVKLFNSEKDFFYL